MLRRDSADRSRVGGLAGPGDDTAARADTLDEVKKRGTLIVGLVGRVCARTA